MALRANLLRSVNSLHMGCVCCRTNMQHLSQHRHAVRASAACNSIMRLAENASNMVRSGLLTSDDLIQYMNQHNIQATVVPAPVNAPAAQIIKSMVLIIKLAAAEAAVATTAAAEPDSPSTSDSEDLDPVQSDSSSDSAAATEGRIAAAAAAVLVLVLGDSRISLSLVARYLKVPRRSVRLATLDEAVAFTGFEVGAIPPFAHRIPLRTLVDTSIFQHQQQQQQWLYAGGGSTSCQLQISVEQLVSATAAETGTFTQHTSHHHHHHHHQQQQTTPAHDNINDSGLRAAGQQQQEQHLSLSWLSALPLPWSPGSDEVELVGVIAQKRRLARLLLFCSLVPESVPPIPVDGTAAYVRRLWRHPMQQSTAEVQLIFGKTLERNLGRAAAASLFDQLKVGAVVWVRGRVQQNPAALKQQQPPSSSSSTNCSSSSSGGLVLDVVTHELRVLHKNRDALGRAVRAAQRQGHKDITTAAQLMQIQLLQQQEDKSGLTFTTSSSHSRSRTAGSPPPHAGVADLGLSPAEDSSKPFIAEQQSEPLSSVFSPSSAAATADVRGSGTAAPAPAADQYWQLPLGPDHIHWVDDLRGIQHMTQHVLGGTACTGTTAHSSSSSSSSSQAGTASSDGSSVSTSDGQIGSLMHGTVVGIDCEWKPYDKGNAANPVALLQIATQTDVFLVDLLAICQQQQPSDADIEQQHSGDTSYSNSSTDNSKGGRSGIVRDAPVQQCSAAEAALGNFLLAMLSSGDVIKVGFGLPADLVRLQQSYPHLACFNPSAVAAAGVRNPSPAGAAPLTRHIDLPQLSRTALPSIHKHNTSLSLSRLVAAVLGKPLDKSQQTSNWEQRPLSHAQQMYAAVDGHVLTVVFDVLMQRWLDVGGDVGLLDRMAAGSVVKYLPVTDKLAAGHNYDFYKSE